MEVSIDSLDWCEDLIEDSLEEIYEWIENPSLIDFKEVLEELVVKVLERAECI